MDVAIEPQLIAPIDRPYAAWLTTPTVARCEIIDLVRRSKFQVWESIDRPIANNVSLLDPISDASDLLESLATRELASQVRAALGDGALELLATRSSTPEIRSLELLVLPDRSTRNDRRLQDFHDRERALLFRWGKVISLDLPSTFFCPNTNLLLAAQALTVLITPRPFLSSPEFRDCFPSNVKVRARSSLK